MPNFTIENKIFVTMETIANSRHKRFGYGGMMIVLGENKVPVWFSGDISSPTVVKWNWIGLLSFFVSHWAWIFSEQNIPFAVKASHIPTYWFNSFHKIKEDIFSADVHNAEKKSALKAFCSRHDLAEAVPGISMPHFFILRSGQECIIASGKIQIIITLRGLHELLSNIGDEIISWMGDALDNNHRDIIKKWNMRDTAMKSEIESKISLLASMDRDVMDFLSDKNPNFWEIEWHEGFFTESAIFAAARMTSGYATSEEQKIVLDTIKTAPPTQSPDLESATQKIGWLHWGNAPSKQGYHIAEKFRAHLKKTDTTPLNPEEILTMWKIGIQEVQLASSAVEAVACWGKRHGPLVILNIAPGKKASHAHGRKFTLGHELCHLLVDRGSTLDVCEVLGGATLSLFEKRANAFAAELLFPKNLAKKILHERDGTIADNIDTWRTTYEVTKENIAAQILNHPENHFTLSQTEKDFLEEVLGGDNTYGNEE